MRTTVPLPLAVDVAASLVASGVPSTTRVAGARIKLLVRLDTVAGTMAVLDLADLSRRVTIDEPGAPTRTAPGLTEPGSDTCLDPDCLARTVWSWTLRWRGTTW